MFRLFLIASLIVFASCAQRKETAVVEETPVDTAQTKRPERVTKVDTTFIKPTFDYTLNDVALSKKDELGTIWTDKTTSSYRFVASQNRLLVYKNRELFRSYVEIVAVEKRTSIPKASDPFDGTELTDVTIMKSSGDVIAKIFYTQKGLFGDVGEITYTISDRETLKGDFKTEGPKPLKPLTR